MYRHPCPGHRLSDFGHHLLNIKLRLFLHILHITIKHPQLLVSIPALALYHSINNEKADHIPPSFNYHSADFCV
jgi:hypothetical protein